MKKEYKSFEFKINEIEEDGNVGVIEGYAAVFGNVDLGNDVIEKGAFRKTIKDRKGRWPILLDHDPTRPAGVNLEAEEDDFGLKVKGELTLVDPQVRHRFELIKQFKKAGVKAGLSIGYRTVKHEILNPKPEPGKISLPVRRLKEVMLMEHSIVTFPMNEKAGTKHAGAQMIEHLILFEAAQKSGMDLTKLRQALQDLGSGESPEDEAAVKEIDPQTLQSVDDLIQAFKSR